MKKVFFCTAICFLPLAGCALNYSYFPIALQEVLDRRIAELAVDKKGICIAGRVQMSDGSPVSNGRDVKVNFFQDIDESLWVYDGGWFIMDRVYQPGPYHRPARLALRAFGYDPVDASFAPLRGRVTYVEFVLPKTPVRKLTAISGIVVNENDEPIEGARVRLSFPSASQGVDNEPARTSFTREDGSYGFEGLSVTEHSLIATASGYAYLTTQYLPSVGESVMKNLKLYRNRRIMLHYVYQADGSRSFIKGDIKEGTLQWINGNEGVDFSDGRVEEYDVHSLRDIEMRQEQDALKFQVFHVNRDNGFYDAGAVALDSVVEAAESGYQTRPKPCIVGHVYVVKTYEGHYAKFIVKEIAIN